MKNTYKFKRHVDIGNIAAEDDNFLLKAFVSKGELSQVLDIDSTGCILLGRTGTGKSALIRYIEENEEDVVRIEPEEMSLRHLSNSTIISYFKALDVKLDLFYKVLWRHVFIVELIKLRFNGDSKSSRFIEWLQSNVLGDRRKAKALKYLEDWENQFWKTTEHHIKEIEQGLEKRFLKEAGVSASMYESFKATGKIAEESTSTDKVKSEMNHKAQKVVNESQIEEIGEIMKILASDLFAKTQKKYFVLVDDLDKDWVDELIVYDLIKALIEVINEFRSVKPAKIVIALRSNILKRAFHKNLTRGVQREKQKHLYLEIAWSKEELEQLLNNRLKELMKVQYTNEFPSIENIMPTKTDKYSDGFTYMIERTLMRPRDVIDFFNKCIKHADGKTKISREVLRSAEDEYSHERLQALNDEWFENYGSLFVLYSFLKAGTPRFRISDIEEAVKEHFVVQMGKNEHDSLSAELKADFDQFGESFDALPLLNRILGILYEIGLIGVKISPDKPTSFSYESYSIYKPEEFTEETKFYVHRMFHRALRIKNKK